MKKGILLALALALVPVPVGAVYVEADGEPMAVASTPEDGCLVFDLGQACEPIPRLMAVGIAAVINCESKWDVEAVGRHGERGLLQVGPRHAEAMARAGRDFVVERDRIAWSVRLWERWGWEPWACRP